MQSITTQLLEIAKTDPDRVFAKIRPSGDTKFVRLSYQDLVEGAMKVAALLARTTTDQQNVIIIMLPTSIELLHAFIGGIFAHDLPSIFPVNPSRVQVETLANSLRQSAKITRAEVIITTKEIKELLLGDDDMSLRIISPDDWVEQSTNPALPSINMADFAFLQHSSGTTGLKKGVAISHEALVNQLTSYSKRIDLRPEDKIVCWLPLYHDMGLITGLLLPLLKKVPVVLIDPFDWVLNPVLFLRAISDEEATICWLPNFSYPFMAQKIPSEELTGISLSSLRAVINCSEPITTVAHETFYKRFKEIGFRREALATCYAMAENTFAVTQSDLLKAPHVELADLASVNRSGEVVPAKEGYAARSFVSSGTPIDGVIVKIVDDTGHEVAEKVVGEVTIRGESMLREYFRQPELSRAALREGWYCTGDLGFKVGEELFVTGRKKDMIILSGKNIYPQDVEDIVAEAPEIHPGRVAAFGVFNEETGTEELVVLAESNNNGAQEIARLERRIDRQVALRLECTVEHVRILPRGTLIKSTSGKISRSGCRDLWLDVLIAADERGDVGGLRSEPSQSKSATIKAMGQAYAFALLSELLIQSLSLLIPAWLLTIAFGNVVVFALAMMLSFYLYSIGILLLVGLTIRLIPKPDTGPLEGKGNSFKWALLTALFGLVRRTPARWIAWVFPFPGHLFYRLCGARIHGETQIGSSETMFLDPYLIEIGRGCVMGHGCLLSGHIRGGTGDMLLGRIKIGKNVMIGAGASIWPNVEIGDGAVVQERASVMPGAVIPPGQVWGGSPASSIVSRAREEHERGRFRTNVLDPDKARCTAKDIRAAINAFLQTYGRPTLTEDDFKESLVNSGAINSLHFVDLVAYLETTFGVELLDEAVSVRNLSLGELTD